MKDETVNWLSNAVFTRTKRIKSTVEFGKAYFNYKHYLWLCKIHLCYAKIWLGTYTWCIKINTYYFCFTAAQCTCCYVIWIRFWLRAGLNDVIKRYFSQSLINSLFSWRVHNFLAQYFLVEWFFGELLNSCIFGKNTKFFYTFYFLKWTAKFGIYLPRLVLYIDCSVLKGGIR